MQTILDVWAALPWHQRLDWFWEQVAFVALCARTPGITFRLESI
jgi:hypothetical protein